MRLHLITTPSAILCLLLSLLLTACGDDGDGLPGTRSDSGAELDADSGFMADDSGTGGGTDASTPPITPAGVSAHPGHSEDEGMLCGPSCADGCGGACCIGESTALCCLEPPEPTRIDFGTCSDPEECAVAVFGASGFAGPTGIEGAAGWTGGGDLRAEGGAILGPEVDLASERLRLTATFERPADCGTCLDVLAVGVAPQAPTASDFHVSAGIALRYSPGFGAQAMLLEVGERVRARFEVPSGADPHTWTLELLPNGDVIVTQPSGAAERFVDVWTPITAVPLMFGRSVNPGESVPSRLSSIELSSSLCDMPTAWFGSERVAFESGSDEPPRHPTFFVDSRTPSPSDAIAFVQGGQVQFRARQRDGEFGPSRFSAPGITGEISHLDIVETAEELWLLYIDEDGALRRARLAHDIGPSIFTPDDEPLLTPADCACEEMIPTAAAAPDGRAVVFVIASRVDNEQRLDAYTAMAGTSLVPIDGAVLPAYDEADGDIALVLHDRAWQLYTQRTRGTRGFIDLWVSDQMLEWRGLETVFSGSAAAFDSLGTESFDASPNAEGVSLYYVGINGVNRALGFTERRAPNR